MILLVLCDTVHIVWPSTGHLITFHLLQEHRTYTEQYSQSCFIKQHKLKYVSDRFQLTEALAEKSSPEKGLVSSDDFSLIFLVLLLTLTNLYSQKCTKISKKKNKSLTPTRLMSKNAFTRDSCQTFPLISSQFKHITIFALIIPPGFTQFKDILGSAYRRAML